jgi:shikimate dehydrogenase
MAPMTAADAPVTLCGSLSRHPVALGMAMHRAGYEALGLPFTYVPFAVEDLRGALVGMRALGIRGFGVSMPFKLDVIPLLDRLDELAQRIGAVNTIVNESGVLVGYNTDAWGAARALEEAIPIAGRRIMILGAGGAARAVALSLAAEGASVHIVNRTVDKAMRIAAEISGATAGGLDDVRRLSDFDAVVNCSSAGMVEYGRASPVPEDALRAGLVVMDIVYKPLKTELLELAEQRGARTVHGGRMLLYQACRQFELYTGRPAPRAAMNAALEEAIVGNLFRDVTAP